MYPLTRLLRNVFILHLPSPSCRPSDPQKRRHDSRVSNLLHRLDSQSQPAAAGEHSSLGQLPRADGPLPLPDLGPDTHGDRGGDVQEDGPTTSSSFTQWVREREPGRLAKQILCCLLPFLYRFLYYASLLPFPICLV